MVVYGDSSSVDVKYDRTLGGLYHVTAIEPYRGEIVLEDFNHIIGSLFPDLDAMRRAVISAFSGDVGDTLDNVLLSHKGYTDYMNWVNSLDPDLFKNISPSDISDERAKPLPDGRLLIWIDILPATRLEKTIDKDDWSWKKRPN